MDEVRVSKGIARWTANFTPPTRAYATFSAGDGVFTGELSAANTLIAPSTVELTHPNDGYTTTGFIAKRGTTGDAASLSSAGGAAVLMMRGSSAYKSIKLGQYNGTSLVYPLVIDGSQNATFSSNVGIGTTSLYAGTNVTSLTINATSYPTLSFNIGNTISHVIMGYSTSLNIDAIGNRGINLRTNDTDRLSISAAGVSTFAGTVIVDHPGTAGTAAFQIENGNGVLATFYQNDYITMGGPTGNSLVCETNGNTTLTGALAGTTGTFTGQLSIDSSSTTHNTIASYGRYGPYHSCDVSTGYGLYIARNLNEAGSHPLANFVDSHATNTQTTVYINHVGSSGYGLDCVGAGRFSGALTVTVRL